MAKIHWPELILCRQITDIITLITEVCSPAIKKAHIVLTTK